MASIRSKNSIHTRRPRPRKKRRRSKIANTKPNKTTTTNIVIQLPDCAHNILKRRQSSSPRSCTSSLVSASISQSPHRAKQQAALRHKPGAGASQSWPAYISQVASVVLISVRQYPCRSHYTAASHGGWLSSTYACRCWPASRPEGSHTGTFNSISSTVFHRINAE